jgi:hypothetical protein
MKLVTNIDNFRLRLHQPWHGYSHLTLIDAFRQPPPPGHHIFHSSGTTAKERSQSWYSSAGLECYRATALKAFATVIAAKGENFVAGVSLIPPAAAAPKSSLSQMLSWIAEVYPVSFVETMPPQMQYDGPIFVFATALQLFALKDLSCRLPEGSIVVETGGFKGRHVAIDRPELYAAISKSFNIGDEQIVSEFGMCELASQAYDFVPQGKNLPLAERRFLFPDSRVQLAVAVGDGRLKPEGVGALVILDSNRSDFLLPLQLEDIVDLAADGTFRLLRRNRFSPLKGCSLNLEGSRPLPVVTPQSRSFVDATPILWLRNWLSQNREAFVSEFGSSVVGNNALNDFISDIPDSRAELERALATAGQLSGETTLVIPPNNHSLAALYPIFFALAAGYTVLVRKPSGISRLPILQKLLADLVGTDLKIRAIENRHFSSRADLPSSTHSLICFGQETTTTIVASLGLPCVLFGEVLTAAIVTEEELQDKDVRAAILRDVHSLNQQGCLCVRLLIVVGNKFDQTDFLDFTKKLLAEAESYQLPIDLALAHDKQQAQLNAAGITTFSRSKELFCFHAPAEHELAIAKSPCTLPIVTKSNLRNAVNFIMGFAGTRRLAASATLNIEVEKLALEAKNNNQIQWVQLGAANHSRWDGTYLGKSLFREMKIN